MTITVKTLAFINLVIQFLLVAVLSVAAYYSIKKKNFKIHCRILRFAVPVQILAIVFIMLPSLLGYLENAHQGPVFNTELLVHHTLGLIVIAGWVYANLVMLRIIKPFIRLKYVMRLAFASWIVAFLMGVYLYFTIYGI